MEAHPPLASDLATYMLIRAERHARAALEALHGVAAEPDPVMLAEAREQLSILLQTEYLFPQLLRWQHSLLVTLYWQKQALTRLVNAQHRGVPRELRTRAERLTRHVEQHFMDLVREVRVLIRCDRLPPTQKILFERMYERIAFDEEPM